MVINMLPFNSVTKDYKIRQMRLTRTKYRRINSLDLIPEDPTQEELQAAALHQEQIDGGNNDKATRADTEETKNKVLIICIEFLLNFLLRLIRYILCVPLAIAAPSFWLSALLWIFWKLTRLPISCIRWLLNYDGTETITRHKRTTNIRRRTTINTATITTTNNQRRTVLISGGSTLQTLHLARNLYNSGARVIVCEFEGLFYVSRFSTAVDKFFIVPRPTRDNINSYIAALSRIVEREKAVVYVPVCVNNSAYYDALVKPHLELLGCACFIPSVHDTSLFDDCFKLFEKCIAHNLPVPTHQLLSAVNDLTNCYDSGFIGNSRNILMAVGKHGLLERQKYLLPNNKQQLIFKQTISEEEQWLLLRDVPGEHFLTCTTVKDSRVLSNVSCLIEPFTNNLIPIDKDDVNEHMIINWLQTFFIKVRFTRPINGHISFRLVKCQQNDVIMPLSAQVGVSLPYICYNRSQAQMLKRTLKCGHIEQLNLIERNFTISHFVQQHSAQSSYMALDKREALFAYWDPLPYCAYYHFQLPLCSVKTFLQCRQRNCKKIVEQSQ